MAWKSSTKPPSGAASKAKPEKTPAKAKPKKSEALSSPSRDQSVSISVRKIDNGYLTSRSEYRNGNYVSRETFTPSKPKIIIGVTAKEE